MATHSIKDYGDDSDNKLAEHVSTASLENVPIITRTRREPSELIKNMSLEERQYSEKALVRKIDLRLLPMIVLMPSPPSSFFPAGVDPHVHSYWIPFNVPPSCANEIGSHFCRTRRSST